MNTLTHGKRSTYNRGCRCDECRAAHTRYSAELRERHKERLDTAQFEHGAAAYSNWGCRCDVCTKAHTQACAPAVKRWRKNNPEKVRENNRRWQERNPEWVAQMSRRHQANRQARTLEKADRHYYRWGGDELELAAREDLSHMEVALLTGRSYHAVRNMRRKLSADAEVAS